MHEKERGGASNPRQNEQREEAERPETAGDRRAKGGKPQPIQAEMYPVAMHEGVGDRRPPRQAALAQKPADRAFRYAGRNLLGDRIRQSARRKIA